MQTGSGALSHRIWRRGLQEAAGIGPTLLALNTEVCMMQHRRRAAVDHHVMTLWSVTMTMMHASATHRRKLKYTL